jgi:integrase
MKIKNLRPDNVHVKGGRYYFVKHNKWKGLSRVDEGLRELYRRLSLIDGEARPGNMLAIFVKYAEGPMLKLAPSTQKQYSYFFFGTEMVEGILNYTFGHFAPHEIQPTDVAQYLAKAEKKGGPAAGNRAKAALSSVFEFAMREGWAKYNPCRGVRRNKETASKVRIKSSAELAGRMDAAPDHFAPVMQFAYVTGVREIDIIKMEVAAITPDGIRYIESKTGKPAWHPWTPTLRALVREILEARNVRMNRPYTNKYRKPREMPVHNRLFTNRFGKPLTMWGITSNMRRLNPDGWSFRSMRSKAQNDGGDLGHMGQMRETYTKERKLRPVR